MDEVTRIVPTVTHDATPYRTAAALRKLPVGSVVSYLWRNKGIPPFCLTYTKYRDGFCGETYAGIARDLRSPRLIAFTLVIPEVQHG